MPRGTNAGLMKESNKKLILNLIRQGGYSRADLAKKMGLTKATLSILADEMLQEGIIEEEVVQNYGGVGRRPLLLKIRENARYTIGVDLFRTHYYTGIFNLSGEALKIEKHSYLPKDAISNLKNMADVIEEYKGMVPEESLLGIGVASPGPLDYKSGVILNPPNFDMWRDCKFAEILSELCGLPVRIENLSNAMALAESYFGCCKQEKNFAYVVVDEGIGSGIVVGDKLYRGQRGYGNELGHISIAFDGRECSCGNRGCLERYATISEILRGTNYKSWSDVVEKNDSALILREAEYLGCAITGLINLFDLGTIVLGGAISEKGEDIAEEIGKIVNQRKIVPHPVRVVLSRAGEKRVLASVAVAMSSFFY